MTKGLFITLEGGEGGGKSTQSRKLKEYLEQKGREVVLTREPGGTPEAEKIRALFMDSNGTWSPVAECMLLFAARAMHVRDCIKPALDAGKIVICDRFTDSTRAYQGYAGGMDKAVLEQLKTIAIGDFEPDITFILDLPANIGLGRAAGRLAKSGGVQDRLEGKALAFHEALRQGFLDIAAKNPSRCRVIDATQSIDHVFQDICKHI